MHAMPAKSPQALSQVLPRQVEIFVNIFQSCWSYGLHSHQRAFNSCRFHCIKEFGVFGGLHCDLGEENHVVGKLRQARHQFKALVADGREFIQPGSVLLLCREFEVGLRDRIKIVVRERHKAKAKPTQLHDFLDVFPEGSYSEQAKQVLKRLEAQNKPSAAVSN